MVYMVIGMTLFLLILLAPCQEIALHLFLVANAIVNFYFPFLSKQDRNGPSYMVLHALPQ